jgi:L-lactate dehydrogenase complex protein LldG
MSERENILGRIREALQVSAPNPAALHDAGACVNPGAPSGQEMRAWLPQVGQTFEERLALFSRNAADLKAEFKMVASAEDLLQQVAALRDECGWTKTATHRGELTDMVASKLGLASCLTDMPYDPSELESCSAGITQCDALVAQTGSVLLTSRSAGGRALSVLPPHHVVLARRTQMTADLPEAFALLKERYAPNYPSFISLITGPSRTGDIERILVLGAHGPKRLSILCW